VPSKTTRMPNGAFVCLTVYFIELGHNSIDASPNMKQYVLLFRLEISILTLVPYLDVHIRSEL
jgi:hypothetical protein